MAGADEGSETAHGAGLRLHHLRPAPGARTARTRVGRGEASKGKTAGRGTKGTKARDRVPASFEGGQMPLHRRLPQLKGFSNLRFKTTYQVVNTGRLAELYPEGGDVTPEDLAAKGAVRAGEPVKVLGTGDVSAPLRVSAHAFSASAKGKITAAGGTVTTL
jgi:large subunit ribosomal protein L15